MKVRIPLSCFTAHLNEVKEKRRDFPNLDEVGFLTDNFRFDDESATYEPVPVDPCETLLFQLARN
jgi:hypothetical protein